MPVSVLEEGPAVAVPAFIVSLDFELHWGVRDRHDASSGYMAAVRGARDAVPRMLDLFAQYEIAATWATVGFLFAESREELEFFSPRLRPAYANGRLDPYAEPIGANEIDDPLHYAASLVRLIASAPHQEVATHTYSHYYCLEAGSSLESFQDDLRSAVAIAGAKGIRLRSLVLPRNQWNPAYAEAVRSEGLECYRGNQPGWMYAGVAAGAQGLSRRIGRLIDAHLPLTRWEGMAWRDVVDSDGLHNVGATCFLRPVARPGWSLDEARLRRIRAGITKAAATTRLFHIWWHPHNFGILTSESLAFLRLILEHYRQMRASYGMRSMSMAQVSAYASAARPRI